MEEQKDFLDSLKVDQSQIEEPPYTPIHPMKIEGEKLEFRTEPLTEDERKYLDDFVDFIQRDTRIKMDINSHFPSVEDAYDSNSIIKCQERIEDMLKYAQTSLEKICSTYGIVDQKTITALLDSARENLVYSTIRSYDELVRKYDSFIGVQRKEFLDDVNNNTGGYTIFYKKSLNQIASEAKSLNEVLHLIHQGIIRNDMILKRIPKVATLGDRVTVHGDPENPNNEDAIALIKMFKEMPVFTGTTDIVATGQPGKAIIMVRDVGHALTIETSRDKTGTLVKYFIPKICNSAMVNNLRGVKKVPAGALRMRLSTTGDFHIISEEKQIKPEENMARLVLEFIDQVPNDDDIPEFKEILSRRAAQEKRLELNGENSEPDI